MAGAVFGEVGVSLFVAGAAFRSILGGNRGAKCCIFQYKIVSKIGRVRSIAQGDGFASGHESSSSCHCQGHSG